MRTKKVEGRGQGAHLASSLQHCLFRVEMELVAEGVASNTRTYPDNVATRLACERQ